MADLDALDKLEGLEKLDALDGLDELDALDALDEPVKEEPDDDIPEVIRQPIPEIPEKPKETDEDPDVALLKRLGIDTTNVEDWLSGPAGMGKRISADEVDKIVEEFSDIGLTTEDVEKMIARRRGELGPREEEGLYRDLKNSFHQVEGWVDAMLGGFPNWVGKKAAGLAGPREEEVRDVITELVERRMSKVGMGAPMALPSGAVATRAPKALAGLAKAVKSPGRITPGRVKATAKTLAGYSALGAAYGTFGSKRGKEAEGATIGAIASPVLALGIPGLTKAAGKLAGLGMRGAMKGKPKFNLGLETERAIDGREYSEGIMYKLARDKPLVDVDTKKLKNQLKIKDKDIKKAGKEIGLTDEDDIIKAIVTDKAKKEYVQFATEYLPAVSDINKALAKGDVDIGKAIERGDLDAIKVFVKDLNLGKTAEREFETLLKTATNDRTKSALVNRIGENLRKKGRERDVIKEVKGLNKYVDEVERAEGGNIRPLWNQFRFGSELEHQAKKAAGKFGKKRVGEAFSKGGIMRAADFMSASPHVLERADRKLGSDLYYQNLKLNNAIQRADNKTDELVEQYQQSYVRDLRKIENFDRDLFYRHIENPQDVSVPASYDKAVAKHKEIYSKLREDFKEIGLELPKREKYIPHRLKPRNEIRTQIWDDLDKYDKVFKGKTKFKDLVKEDKDFDSFMRGVISLSEHKGKVSSWDKLKSMARDLQRDPRLEERIARVNTSSYRRTGKIPKYLRETDPGKLLTNYIRENVRFAETRGPIREMIKWYGPMKKMGMEGDLNFLKFHLNKAAGYNRGQWDRYIADPLKKRSADFVDSITSPGPVREAMKNAPQVLGQMTNLSYGSLLSSPKSAIRNLEQPFVLTGEDIDPLYGKEIYLRAILPAIHDYGNNASKKLLNKIGLGRKMNDEVVARLEKMGKLPKTQRGESVELDGKIKDVSEVANKILLFNFSQADRLNRITTASMARIIAADAKRGDERALKYLSSGLNSQSVREKMAKKIRNGKWENVRSDVEDYLIQKTQFVYNKNNQSQFANALGPYLSMFSKWPTEIFGDVVTDVTSGNIDKPLTKYLGPLAYLYLLDKTISANDKTYRDMSDSVFPGPGGFTTHAPAMNLQSLYPDEAGVIPMMKTPHVTAGTDLVHGLIGGNRASTKRFLRDSLPTYLGIRAAENVLEKYPELIGMKPPFKVGDEWKRTAKKLERSIAKARRKADRGFEEVLGID